MGRRMNFFVFFCHQENKFGLEALFLEDYKKEGKGSMAIVQVI